MLCVFQTAVSQSKYSINYGLTDWRRPAGRPRTTWLRTIGEDLQSQNFGVHTAWRKAKERERYLASGRQYGNALLGVRHQEEEVEIILLNYITQLA